MKPKQKITTFLWFDDNAEEAIRFYMSIFRNSELVSETRTPPDGPNGKSKLFLATFRLEGQEFMALNAGPLFKFNEAISLYVDCRNQEEIDELWSRLTSDGGSESRCGWLRDKFGLFWQIIPSELIELMSDPDPARAARVREALFKMQKIDIAQLRAAHAG